VTSGNITLRTTSVAINPPAVEYITATFYMLRMEKV